MKQAVDDHKITTKLQIKNKRWKVKTYKEKPNLDALFEFSPLKTDAKVFSVVFTAKETNNVSQTIPKELFNWIELLVGKGWTMN